MLDPDSSQSGSTTPPVTKIFSYENPRRKHDSLINCITLCFRDGLLWSAKPIFTEKNTTWKLEIMTNVIEVGWYCQYINLSN
jgi:hypothetical protein